MTKAVTFSNGTIMFPTHLTRRPSLQSVRYVKNVVSLPAAAAPSPVTQKSGDVGQPAGSGSAVADLSLPGKR